MGSYMAAFFQHLLELMCVLLCTAVWVYCGNLDLCGGQYKECWLKHLVSSWQGWG
jgi:hypothetical protein